MDIDKALATIEAIRQDLYFLEGQIKGSVPDDSVAEQEVDPIPHITAGLTILGCDEDHHRDKIRDFIGADPSTNHWCAYYGKACFDAVGMRSLGGIAKEYVKLGEEVDSPIRGDMCLFRNHFSFFYGYADKSKLSELESYGKVLSLEDWELVECDKEDANAVPMVLGGNQSDMCNISPQYFYETFTTFLGYFRHEEQKLNTLA